MPYIRDLKRKLRFKLIQLEDMKFAAYVKTFRLIRNKMLEGPDTEKKRLEFEAEDWQVDNQTKASFEQALFTEVGKALSSWAALEEILVCIASLLLTNSMQKAGVVMYSIINFGAWLGIITELFPHEELYTHLKPKWDKLTSRLRALKDMRDRLAHHSAFKSDVPAEIFKVSSLVPSPYDVRAKSMRYKPLTLTEIQEFNSAVLDIMKALTALVHEMEAIKSAHIKYLDAEIDKLSGTEAAYNKALKAENKEYTLGRREPTRLSEGIAKPSD
jgi:hypothetical protein